MTRRWPILLMLAVVALQGSGSLHAVHMALEHGHHHDSANCSVCQALACLKALTDVPDADWVVGLSPTIPTGMPESFPLPQIALSTLGPRAPPVC
jgi:hypothetical protein